MYLAKAIKCHMPGCKSEAYKQNVYRTWHNVDCFENINIGNWDITWVRNWWICTNHTLNGNRFHDIDGNSWVLFRRRVKINKKWKRNAG